jgi:hypothetical protein
LRNQPCRADYAQDQEQVDRLRRRFDGTEDLPVAGQHDQGTGSDARYRKGGLRHDQERAVAEGDDALAADRAGRARWNEHRGLVGREIGDG